MYNFLIKRGQLVAFLLGVVLVALFLGTAIPGAMESNFNSILKSDKEMAFTKTFFDLGLQIAIGLTVLCLAAAVIFAVIQIVLNLKASLFGLIGFAVMIALFFVFTNLSGAEAEGSRVFDAMQAHEVSQSQSTYISGALKTCLALGAGAIGILILAEVRNFFK